MTKKTRFEVFKRDKFTCQYCGRMAPDVVLEVDHIKPVYENGGNELINLITSCFECNRGKGKKKIDDTSVAKLQAEQIKQLAEKREQLEMILEWHNMMKSYKDDAADCVIEYIKEAYDNESIGISKNVIETVIKPWIDDFGMQLIFEAVDISRSQYIKDVNNFNEINKAFNKIGGICYNIKNNKGKI